MSVSRWVSRIAGSKKGQVELTDALRSGPPTTAITQALLERADDSFETTD
jgi:hypothetical protein